MSEVFFNSLEEIKPSDSGLKAFEKQRFNEKLKSELVKQNLKKSEANPDFLRFLGLFLLAQHKELELVFKEKPELVASVECKALKILNLLKLGSTINSQEIFPLSTKDLLLYKRLSYQLSEKLVELFFDIKTNIKDFDLDLWSLTEVLPDFFYYYAKKLLVLDCRDSYGKITDLISQEKFFSESEKTKVLYLKILLTARTGEMEKLNELLHEYHSIHIPDTEKPAKLISKSTSSFHSPVATLKNWSKILQEVDAIQNEAELLANIYPKTCEYFSCSDCCSFTFPTMSYTEFLYLKKWMQENGVDEKIIRDKSEAIQKDYQEKFGQKLGVIDKSKIENQIRGIENPHDYKFRCPFLSDEGKCSCHPARPLLCRGFGSATNNGVSIKTCNFYLKQYQHNSSPENERYVLELRGLEMLVKASDKYLSKRDQLDTQEPKATIPAWFASY